MKLGMHYRRCHSLKMHGQQIAPQAEQERLDEALDNPSIEDSDDDFAEIPIPALNPAKPCHSEVRPGLTCLSGICFCQHQSFNDTLFRRDL